MEETPDEPKNRLLGAAKAAKNDEFYTQRADIEREMNAYLEYDLDAFRDKTVLLPADDPEWSNFTKYFALHFNDLGLKKLVSTSYAPDSNPAKIDYQPTLFESESPQFDEAKTHANGKLLTLTRQDLNGDGVMNSRPRLKHAAATVHLRLGRGVPRCDGVPSRGVSPVRDRAKRRRAVRCGWVGEAAPGSSG